MPMALDEYKTRFSDDGDSIPGWDAIDKRLAEFYPGVEPQHFGTLIKYMMGGPDPLDGISRYDSQSGGLLHQHFVSYGFSELYYDEEAAGQEFSKFGFELTFRLKPFTADVAENIWPGNLMQNLARYVFESGNWFDNHHWMPANGPIRSDTDTAITGIVFVIDPELGVIDTPHGNVQFLQMVGVTDDEINAIKDKTVTAQEVISRLQQSNPLLITDLERTVSVL
jgi:Suppressor of fused protein (SUFU)